MTGHATINLVEADDAARERRRFGMNEATGPRSGTSVTRVGTTTTGKWLVRPGDQLGPFRTLLGDERADYNQTLQAHYNDGPRADWQARVVSADASA